MTHDPMTHETEHGNPIVFVQNGRAQTSSRTIAAAFEKRHADVVRSVRKLVEQKPELAQRTFALGNYVDENGNPRVAYDMDRNGFTLVAMGFTGQRALDFKWAFIEAFNQIEAELSARSDAGSVLLTRAFPNWSTEEMRAKTAIGYLYARAYGPACLRWAMSEMGFPKPQHDEPNEQFSLNLGGKDQD